MMNGSTVATDLHASAIVIDAEDVSYQDRQHLEEMLSGGVTTACVTVSCFGTFVDAARAIAEMNVLLEQCLDIARPVRTVDDIRDAKRTSRVGVAYTFQNTTALDGDVRFIRLFRELGVRVIQPVWDAANLVGDSGYESRGGGLTRFGREVVKEICRRRIVLDLSHCDCETTLEAIELADAPIAFTHANAASLCSSPRNKTDEEIRMMAASGGVMGVTPLAAFVSDERGDASLKTYCDHIDYVVNLVGAEHAAVGTDFTTRTPISAMMPIAWGGAEVSDDEVMRGDYPYPYADGFESATDFPAVTAELLERGYRSDDVEAILGGNWLRLFGEVWGS
jgi:membrane dipeptidase